MICPMFDTPNCRFFSQEHIFVPYSTLVENPKTKRLCVGSTGIKKEPVGNYCNNASAWVSELTYCPARWGLYGVATSGVKADGTGTYPDSQVVVAPSILFRKD